ncbi:MAG: pyruvate kinase [Planctomycetota bacterium]
MRTRHAISPIRTRIIVTVGPSCERLATLVRMIAAGASVFRLNLSHGDHASHAVAVERIRKAADAVGTHVAILADLPGPKVRTGRLRGGRPVTLKRRAPFVLVSRKPAGDSSAVSVSYAGLWKDVRKGSRIFLDDGHLELVVTEVSPGRIATRVVVGGTLDERKGVNVPGRVISRHAPTAEDLRHLDWALGEGVDYVSLSFVQSPGDMDRLRRHLERRGSQIPIVAKIERASAIEHLEEITSRADVVMVARGDLGVELPFGELPILQKRIIATASRLGVIDITATQILESMRENPRPTRAEAADVANAILDGTDALLLSGETAAGKHPVLAVKALADIARRTEASDLFRGMSGWAHGLRAPAEVAATVRAAAAAASEIHARALAVFTHTGETARLLAELRPWAPIIAFTDRVATARKLALVWGVSSCVIPSTRSVPALLATGRRLLVSRYGLAAGDGVIYTAGSSLAPGGSNLMRVETL